MSRLGKIARLPRTMRDTLNVRLQEGEPGPELLAWLNAEPAVQAVLTAQFKGQPVNAQNLSDWRRGGHALWCQQQQILELAERLHEDKEEVNDVVGGELAEFLAHASLLALLRELRATGGMEEGPERQRAVLGLLRAADRLQGRQCQVERAQREQAKEERTQKEHAKGEQVDEERTARRGERGEEGRPPVPAQPERRSLPSPARPPAGPDDAQISANWAAALKLAKKTPVGPVSVVGSFGPKLPALQAA